MSMKAIFDDLFGPENVSPIVRWQRAEQILVEAPERPGARILRVTLVQESVAWFEDHGVKPVDLPMTVDPA